MGWGQSGEALRVWQRAVGGQTGLPAVGGASGRAGGLCLMQFVMTEGKKEVLGQICTVM